MTVVDSERYPPLHPFRCLLFDSVLYPSSLAMVVAGLPLLVSRRASVWLSGVWVRWIMACARVILGIDCHFRPRAPRSSSRGRILVVNHQSAWETIALKYYYPDSVGVAKRELFWLPFGWYMRRIGYIPIDRGGSAVALRRMIAQVRDRLDRGMDVVIYPEGTRRPVDASPEYRSGIYGLYHHCDADLLPIVHDSGFTWGRRPFARRSGEVRMREGAVIPGGLDKRDFFAVLEQRLSGTYRTMIAEGGHSDEGGSS